MAIQLGSRFGKVGERAPEFLYTFDKFFLYSSFTSTFQVSYRGGYLMTLSMCSHAKIAYDTKYLWTAPMFHCNGWSFPWAVVAMGGM